MDELKEIIQLVNPWWKSSGVSKELAKEFKRDAFNKVKERLNYRQIVILSGLRRVGKTTILYQMIELLLKKEQPTKIFYFTFDKKVESILKILDSYAELSNIDYKKEKIFVFFDEITKVKDWAEEIKILYDSFPNIKFHLSSSSSINLEEDAVKNLTGRYFLINIQPLNFKEYLQLTRNEKILNNLPLYMKEVHKEFKKYLLRSFPETILWEDELIIKDYLRTMIIDKIVKSDLPTKFNNLNKDLLTTLIELIYKEPGMYVDYDHLAKNLKVSKKTLFMHFYYLEFCYLIRKIKNFRPSTFSTTRKLQRVYPYWWTLAYCYTDNFDKIAENLISSTCDLKYYWRENGKEVDFLLVENKKILPIEVKNKDHIDVTDMKNMLYFNEKNKIKKGVLIYNGEEKTEVFEKTEIHLIPFWKFLLQN